MEYPWSLATPTCINLPDGEHQVKKKEVWTFETPTFRRKRRNIAKLKWNFYMKNSGTKSFAEQTCVTSLLMVLFVSSLYNLLRLCQEQFVCSPGTTCGTKRPDLMSALIVTGACARRVREEVWLCKVLETFILLLQLKVVKITFSIETKKIKKREKRKQEKAKGRSDLQKQMLNC